MVKKKTGDDDCFLFLMDFSLGARPPVRSNVLSHMLSQYSLVPQVTASEAVSRLKSSLGLFDLIQKALRSWNEVYSVLGVENGLHWKLE